MHFSDRTQYGGEINTDETNWIDCCISTDGNELSSPSVNFSLSLRDVMSQLNPVSYLQLTESLQD